MVHNIALVLGGGGVAGNTWEIGVIAGLAEAGLAPPLIEQWEQGRELLRSVGFVEPMPVTVGECIGVGRRPPRPRGPAAVVKPDGQDDRRAGGPAEPEAPRGGRSATADSGRS